MNSLLALGSMPDCTLDDDTTRVAKGIVSVTSVDEREDVGCVDCWVCVVGDCLTIGKRGVC